MGFKRIESVAGLYDEQAHEGAKNIACWADALSIKDPWYLLEACVLVPYEPFKPGKSRKSRGEKAPVIKYNRPGQ